MSDRAKIIFKVFPAKNGDCLLVNYHVQDEEKNIVIDCGFPDTWQEHLLPELLALSARGSQLDRLIITHIDSDHLTGAIAFLGENRRLKIKIGQIWHNTFRHVSQLIRPNSVAIVQKDQSVLEQLINRGYHSDHVSVGKISAKQGTTLGAMILQDDYAWNTDFQGRAASTHHQQSMLLDAGVSAFLLSPGEPELVALAHLWQSELRKYDLKISSENTRLYDDAFEMMLTWEKNSVKVTKQISVQEPTPDALLKTVFKEDKGITNGSSIALILEIHQKKLLLLGDAHPSVIQRELHKYQPEGTVLFDLIKLAHHGSFNNTGPALLQRVDAAHYIFSANGKHGHPDEATIAHIICRKADFLRTLYFNYRTASSERFNREDWKKAYGYEINYLDSTDYTLTL
jgi:beta-lactamase superfamily II metal-dependent hydrolase